MNMEKAIKLMELKAQKTVLMGMVEKLEKEWDLITEDIYDLNRQINNYMNSENYDDEKVIVVTYTFTNNSSSDAAYDIVIYEQCFQNGIELNKEFLPKGELFAGTHQRFPGKTRKPGKPSGGRRPARPAAGDAACRRGRPVRSDVPGFPFFLRPRRGS